MKGKDHNRPTIDEYFGLDAEAYAKSRWMAKNQMSTTDRALELLSSQMMGAMAPMELVTPTGGFTGCVLDLGCGTGYSSLVMLDRFSRVVGLDFSRDMMSHITPPLGLNLVQADLRALPFRAGHFSAVISISAYNFVSEGAKSKVHLAKFIRTALTDLWRILPAGGKAVIEFYPTSLELDVFMQVLKGLAFMGGLMVDDQNTRREKKYLLLRKP